MFSSAMVFVTTIECGATNLADSRKFGQQYVTGYRAEFASSRLRVFSLGEFSISDVADYFASQVPTRPLDVKTTESLHRATLGIPLAVRTAAAIWKAGLPLDDIVKNVPPRAPREQIVRVMTERFLVHCFDDPNHPNDRMGLYALALANRPDPNLLGAMLGSANLEYDLSELERRYSFVFVSEMKLHDAISSFMIEYLQAPVQRASKHVRDVNERAVMYLQKQINARETKATSLGERVADNRWTQLGLDLLHHIFWLDEDEGWRLLTATLVAGIGYDPSFARAILEEVAPFIPIMSEPGKKRLDVFKGAIGTSHIGSQADHLSILVTDWLNSDKGFAEAMLNELDAWSSTWSDDGCNSERLAILDFKRALLTGNLEKTVSVLDQARQNLSPSKLLRTLLVDGLSWAAMVYNDQGRSEEAMNVYQKAIAIDRDSMEPHHVLGHIYKDLKRNDDAIAEFKRAIELEPMDPGNYNCLGFLYIGLGKTEEAKSCFEKCVQVDAMRSTGYHGLGHVFVISKDYNNAVLNFRKAIELESNGEYLYNDLGSALTALDLPDEALNAFRRAKELNPERHSQYVALATSYLELKLLDQAQVAFRRIIELEPENDIPMTLLGKIYDEKGEPEKSIEFYRRAIELDKTDADRSSDYYSLAGLYVKLERLQDALDAMRHAIELNPKRAQLQYDLGRLLEQLERDDEAIAAYKLAGELAPKDPNPPHRLGHVLQAQKQNEDALVSFKRAAELDPKESAYPNDIGNVYVQTGRYDDAIAAYRRVLEIDPKLISPIARIAFCFQKLSNNVAHLEQVTIVRELTKDKNEYDRACYESLCGNVDEALAQLQVAIEKKQKPIEEIRNDSDFESIRDDPRFKALTKD